MKRHLIGIGGVGMSALATALLRLGDEVTGADRSLDTPNVRFLRSLGVDVFPDDGSGVDDATDEVIVSTAIEPDNPGLVKAKSLGIPVVHRAKALARALSPYKLVAVVGTCGKSSVTAMLGHVLAECGLDPMCVNGANVVGWEGAVRFGRGEYAVAEVDESDKSLVAFSPYAAIVTNASADHYSKEEMDSVFDAFVKDLPGPLVDARGETYPPQGYERQNASLAVRMAVLLGCDKAAAEKAVEGFRGVERRLQSYGGGVYDDYAHNPEKLRAMWLTLAERHPGGICVVWRPHGYGPLRKMMDALAEMFNEVARPCDKLLLLPVYDAGGTADRSVNSDALAARLRPGVCELVPGLDAAYDWCAAHRGEYDAFVTCGARDPGLPALASRISAAASAARAIVLTDGKAGHENQSKAFARALGMEYTLVPVRFKSPFHKALSYLLDFVGVKTTALFDGLDAICRPGGASAVLGTGSGTFYAAKALARRLGAKCGVVLYPRGYRLSSFDCILAPSFDNPAKRANVIEIPANLVSNDADFYAKGVAAFRERHGGATDRLVGVIVGGPNKCSAMSAEWMKARLDEIFAANEGAQLCVTTSRRTPPDVEAVVDSYPWAYKLIYSRDHFNPIPAFVDLAKRLYVTAESTGMLSEACTFGSAEVFALDDLNPGPHKFRRFVEGLRAGGYVDGNRKIDLSAQFAAAARLLGPTQ